MSETTPSRNPNVRGNPRQSFRYDPDKWERFRKLADPSASDVLKRFCDWYIGEPHSRAPRRPNPRPTPTDPERENPGRPDSTRTSRGGHKAHRNIPRRTQ